MSLKELPVLDRVPEAAQPQMQVDVAALKAELERATSGEVRFDRVSRALYSTDASVYQIVPCGVVFPRTEADIVAAVQACARFGVPLTARGGGTSQAGQSIGAGVILDMSTAFNDVLEINPAERWARVRPGCVLDDLNAQLKPHRLQFAPDISTSNRATIGGMVANNSSGARSVLYGKTVDHVLALRVVLADGSVSEFGPLDRAALEAKCGLQTHEGACYRGVMSLAAEHAEEIERRYPKVLRRVGGYNLDLFRPSQEPDRLTNLAHFFVGSEGTLGVVVEAKLNLVPLPRSKSVLVIQFDDLLSALAATPAILEHRPAAVEVIDRYVLDSTKLNPEASRLRDFLSGDPAAILIVELYGDEPAELEPRLAALEADLRSRSLGDHMLRAADSATQSRVWKLRKLALGLSMAEKGDAKAISFVEDSAVAPERLRDYIAELLEIVKRHGTKAGVYAHASVGCLHVRPVVNLKTEVGVRQFESIAAEVADLVLRYGGALSGEHGDGLVRSPFQEKMYGPALYQAFREIKRTFDPEGILNPGKIVDAPPLATNLRFGPKYQTPSVATTFDFSADGGIVQSAELCAGVGECRKRGEGTMCPSFQATREEEHSTRGRANLLRLAMTGQLGLTGLTDPVVGEALDLCLECKACKSECPTNVDMARLKAEFLHQAFRKRGAPLRNRAFGHVDRLGEAGSKLAPVSSWLMRSLPARWLAQLALGIDARRVPPRFATKTLHELAPALSGGLGPSHADTGIANQVLFFADTFASYYEPAVAVAAIKLLRAAGHAVTVGLPERDAPFSLRCCGRPMISNGLLDEAVEAARHNVARLYPWAAHGAAIVACEPSCLLTIKDDYPALLRGQEQEQARAVARACATFEECMLGALEARDRRFGSLFYERTGTIRAFAHCHARSLVGSGPLVRLLRQIPGADVVDLDAGCCGMAGSFGYEREHYAISRQIGELRLFPAIRNAREGDALVASGFSCRMQIEHFTRTHALHPAELLAGLLRKQAPVSSTPGH